MSSRSMLVLVVLLVAAPLTGCLDRDADPSGARVDLGDLVRVAYVLRDGDGTLLESSSNGSGTPDLSEVAAPGHDPVWWFVFDEETAKDRPGPGQRIRATFRDRLPPKGSADLIVQADADVAEDGTLSNRSTSIWDLPEPVSDPETPVTGLVRQLVGRHEGQLATGVEVPPDEAHGEHDPEKVRSFPRYAKDQERDLGPYERRPNSSRANITEETEEGDVIGYRLLEDNWVDAKITLLNDTHVAFRLLVDNGTLLPRDTLWPGRIVNVNRTHFEIEQVVEVGETWTVRNLEGRVTSVGQEQFTIDFNHRYAGRTLVYDVAIQQVVGLSEERHLRGRQTDPFEGETTVHDLEWGDRFTLLAATDEGAFLTFDGGRHWHGFSPRLADRPVEILRLDREGLTFAKVEEGLLRSPDAGRSWSPVEGLAADGRGIVDVAPARGDRVYAVEADGTIHVSRDDGVSWDPAGQLPGTAGLVVDPGNASTVWAATESGIARSDDAGASWTTIAFPDATVGAVRVATSDVLYALVDGTLMRSADGGDSWTRRAPDDEAYDALGALPDAPEHVAIARANLVGVSQNGGRGWQAAG